MNKKTSGLRMFLPTHFFRSLLQIFFLLQFLIVSFIVNSQPTYTEREKKNNALGVFVPLIQEKKRKLLILCRFLPFFFAEFFFSIKS
jgi:hypothetical protein